MLSPAEQLASVLNGIQALTQALHAEQASRAQPQTTPPSAQHAAPSYRRRIDAKNLRIQEFSGEPDKWADWAFAFKRTIRSMDTEVYKVMTDVESMNKDINEMEDLDGEQDKMSAELYDILCQACTGEALSVVRSVDDCEGIRAWQRLHNRYNPKTVARMIQMLGEVTSPQKVKELKDIEIALNKWEDKVKIMDKEFKESFKDPIKIAIMTNMMPITVQDYVYTNITKESTYREVVDKIRVLVSNKVAMAMGPAPMDIGEVQERQQFQQSHQHDHDDKLHGGSVDDIGAAGMHVKCHQCEGATTSGIVHPRARARARATPGSRLVKVTRIYRCTRIDTRKAMA